MAASPPPAGSGALPLRPTGASISISAAVEGGSGRAAAAEEPHRREIRYFPLNSAPRVISGDELVHIRTAGATLVERGPIIIRDASPVEFPLRGSSPTRVFVEPLHPTVVHRRVVTSGGTTEVGPLIRHSPTLERRVVVHRSPERVCRVSSWSSSPLRVPDTSVLFERPVAPTPSLALARRVPSPPPSPPVTHVTVLPSCHRPALDQKLQDLDQAVRDREEKIAALALQLRQLRVDVQTSEQQRTKVGAEVAAKEAELRRLEGEAEARRAQAARAAEAALQQSTDLVVAVDREGATLWAQREQLRGDIEAQRAAFQAELRSQNELLEKKREQLRLLDEALTEHRKVVEVCSLPTLYRGAADPDEHSLPHLTNKLELLRHEILQAEVRRDRVIADALLKEARIHALELTLQHHRRRAGSPPGLPTAVAALGPASDIGTPTSPSCPRAEGEIGPNGRSREAEELIKRLQQALSVAEETLRTKEAELVEWRAGLLGPESHGRSGADPPPGSAGRPRAVAAVASRAQLSARLTNDSESSGSANSFSLEPGALELPNLAQGSGPTGRPSGASEEGNGDREGDGAAASAGAGLEGAVAEQRQVLSVLKARAEALDEEVLAKQRACRDLELEQVELLRRSGTGGAEAVAQRELLVRCAALEEENGGLREHSRAAAQEMAALKLQLLRAEQAMEAQEYHMQSREVLLEVQKQRNAQRDVLPGPVLRPASTPNGRHLDEALFRQEALISQLRQTLLERDEDLAALRRRLPLAAAATPPSPEAGPP
eukprot:EG_transcript_4004